MVDYLAQYSILYKYQSGFRAKHSTDLCLSYLNDKILKDFDNTVFTGMVLIDLQKTFDTIDHNILLEKYTVRNILLKSYLVFVTVLSIGLIHV